MQEPCRESIKPDLIEANGPHFCAANDIAQSPLLRRFNHAGFAASLYLFLTLAMTYPLARHFRSSVPAGTIDLWLNYWNLWWWKKCLLDLHQHPYFTQYLFHPTGVDVVFHTHSVFNMLVSMPVNIAWGPGAAYNSCVLLALWLSALGTYLLARELTGDGRGAFLAGLVFGFFPQRLDQSIEQLNLVSTQFIPLTLFYFERLRRSGGWRNVLGMGVCYAANALCDWHLGIKLSLALIALAVVALIRSARPAPRLLRDWAIAGMIAALMVLPAVWPLMRGFAAGEPYFQKPQIDRGIDAAFLFLPTFHHPLWGGLTADAYSRRRAYESIAFICYLGFTPVALAMLALCRRRKGSGFWAGLFLVTLVLSLGARPLWNGSLIESVTLPFALLSQIPLFSLMRIAHRFLILTSLALAVLAAFGWASLQKKAGWKLAALSALILLEYLPGRYPLQKNRLPPVYEQLAKSTRQGAVLDIPFTADPRTIQNMRAQTAHERRIAGGRLSTVPPRPLEFIRENPVLSDLFGLDPPYQHPLSREGLLELGFDTVILHKDRAESVDRRERAALDPKALFYSRALDRLQGMPDAKVLRMRADLERIGGAPQFEDETLAVFSLR